MKKIFSKIIILSMFVILGCSNQEKKVLLKERAKEVLQNEWVEEKTGTFWYDGDGNITKNQWIKYGKDWYYVGADGKKIVKTFYTVEGILYYFDEEGKMLKNTSINDENGNEYKIDENGVCINKKDERTKQIEAYQAEENTHPRDREEWIKQSYKNCSILGDYIWECYKTREEIKNTGNMYLAYHLQSLAEIGISLAEGYYDADIESGNAAVAYIAFKKYYQEALNYIRYIGG